MYVLFVPPTKISHKWCVKKSSVKIHITDLMLLTSRFQLSEIEKQMSATSPSIYQSHALRQEFRYRRYRNPAVNTFNGIHGQVTRQLDNVIFRAVLLESNVLERQHLQLPAASSTINLFDEMTMGTLEQEVKRFEMNLLRSLYPSYPSTRQLAKKLGLSHTAIANKLREYGINKNDVKI